MCTKITVSIWRSEYVKQIIHPPATTSFQGIKKAISLLYYHLRHGWPGQLNYNV